MRRLIHLVAPAHTSAPATILTTATAAGASRARAHDGRRRRPWLLSGPPRRGPAPQDGGHRTPEAQDTARRITRVAHARVSAQSGTSTAKASHTAWAPNEPAARSRAADTR